MDVTAKLHNILLSIIICHDHRAHW